MDGLKGGVDNVAVLPIREPLQGIKLGSHAIRARNGIEGNQTVTYSTWIVLEKERSVCRTDPDSALC